MSNETQTAQDAQKAQTSFGARLKAAREALHMERGEVAQQLRLNERVIVLMEKDRYSPDLPITFVRGYLRSYAKFLHIPEYEIKKALEHITFKPTLPAQIKPLEPLHNENYFIKSFTIFVFFTIASLTTAWWYNQNHGFIPHHILADASSGSPRILANNTLNTTSAPTEEAAIDQSQAPVPEASAPATDTEIVNKLKAPAKNVKPLHEKNQAMDEENEDEVD